MRSTALLLVVCCLCSLLGCKSAEEKCEDARVSAEQAWGAYIASLESARAAAIATQAEATSKLSGPIELRLSDAAARAASLRYDRNTDAWQRAYQANQNSGCASDPECAQLKQANADAVDRATDLAHKLPLARAALTALRADAQATQRSATEITPEQGNLLLQTAKQSSDAVVAACEGVSSNEMRSSSSQTNEILNSSSSSPSATR